MDTQSARRFAPARLGAIAVLSALLSMAGFAVLVSPAMGKPDYLAEFNKKYDTRGSKLDSCNTCHTTPQDAQHLNSHGLRLDALEYRVPHALHAGAHIIHFHDLGLRELWLRLAGGGWLGTLGLDKSQKEAQNYR